MRELELLAPARNADIGIAAIDCGADAVYIAGPMFGARQAAGNEIADIRRLCEYAHRYGARIFVTLNTMLFDDELDSAREMMMQIRDAGADALIVQDMAVPFMAAQMNRENPGSWNIPLHASTQCAIRTGEKAEFLSALGFSRLILERELSLQQIREISASTDCEIEFFVHGALCVCYSGQCYLSEKIAGRSANRGACIQACRSRYDLYDRSGQCLVRNKALLSLKDYQLKDRLEELAEAGVSSFKIEGRLKNEAYVRNVVRDYSMALDELVARYPDKYVRASFGKTAGGFTPDSNKTFNRAYTELFLDGRKGKWAAMDAAKSMGEELGTVCGLKRDKTGFSIKPINRNISLHNGDGLSFIDRKGEIAGVRADVCEGLSVKCKSTAELYEGARIFRNFDHAFNKAMEAAPCKRQISVRTDVDFDGESLKISAVSEDGRIAGRSYKEELWNSLADNTERMCALLTSQLSKSSDIYKFSLGKLEYASRLPLLSAATLNSIRKELAEEIDRQAFKARPMSNRTPLQNLPQITDEKSSEQGQAAGEADYKANISNHLANEVYRSAGFRVTEEAYELCHNDKAELMRSKYCIRQELGLCPKQKPGLKAEPLFLLNNGQRFTVAFDCMLCEMIVKS